MTSSVGIAYVVMSLLGWEGISNLSPRSVVRADRMHSRSSVSASRVCWTVESCGRSTSDSSPYRARLAILVGFVLDSADAPIEEAEVELRALGIRARSDPRGRFVISGIPEGQFTVTFRKVGWAPAESRLSFAADDSLNHVVRLARLTILEARLTLEHDPRLREFNENRRIGLGQFLGPEDLARARAAQTAQLFSRLRGAYVKRTPSGRAYVVSNRGPRSISGTPCGINRYADVWLDDVLVYRWRPGEPGFDINQVPPDKIKAVEFYSGPSQTPVKYQNLDTTCGVVVIWTER